MSENKKKKSKRKKAQDKRLAEREERRLTKLGLDIPEAKENGDEEE